MDLALSWCPPCPELARDVTQCPPGPHRGLSSGATCPSWAQMAGFAFLCPNPSQLGVLLAALGPARSGQCGLVLWGHLNQPAQPGGLQPRERDPHPSAGGQSLRLRSRQGTGSRGGSLLPLPAPGDPTVPGFGAASLSVTLCSLSLLSFKDTCPWIRYHLNQDDHVS